MKIKEKIRKIYQKNNVKVDDDYIENAMKDKERVKAYMRLYEEEKLESMNYILGKDRDNKNFTEFELKALSKVNLFNRKVIKWCKLIWDNRDNEENLDEILNALKERRCPKCI